MYVMPFSWVKGEDKVRYWKKLRRCGGGRRRRGEEEEAELEEKEEELVRRRVQRPFWAGVGVVCIILAGNGTVVVVVEELRCFLSCPRNIALTDTL